MVADEKHVGTKLCLVPARWMTTKVHMSRHVTALVLAASSDGP